MASRWWLVNVSKRFKERSGTEKGTAQEDSPYWEARFGQAGADTDDRLSTPLQDLARRFHEWFANSPAEADAYHLPAEVLLQRLPGHISNEWSVRWVFGDQDGDEYLEFYARNRMTNDRRVRMYFSGRTESMPAPADSAAGVLGLPSTERDLQLREELRQRGLLPQPRRPLEPEP